MATSWEHLLSGYATDTLTDEEKRQLFEAALHDQTLFDTLADEEALKAMLADPETRQRILDSLRATEYAGGATREGGGWWGWFRQPSRLAWAGSLAALGLVLIFGWQMEKEWGPVVSQEQEAARSSSKEEGVSRPQKPADESAAARKEALERPPAQTERIEGVTQHPAEPTSRVESGEVDQFRQVSSEANMETDEREKGQAIGRQRANEQVVPAPSLPSTSDQPKTGRMVQPLATPEVAMPNQAPKVTVPATGADQLVEEALPSSPSAQELFYAASGLLGDEVLLDKNDKDRADQDPSEGLPNAGKPSSKKKALSFPLERDPAGDTGMPPARGLRYSFVQAAKDGQDEEVEIRKINGNWSEIRLSVESNVPGYLYVLAPLGNGKWQRLVTLDPGKMKQTEAGINVKSFQRVEFPLRQLTNALGKPVVSSLTVLLSTHPLDDLGQWLGREIDMSEFQIEHADGAVIVVELPMWLERPLQFDIQIEN